LIEEGETLARVVPTSALGLDTMDCWSVRPER
jgi:hypothetical protein